MSETGKKSRSHRRSLCCLIVVVSLKQMILCFQLMTLSEFLRLRLQGLITTLIRKQCHICSNYLYYQIVYDNQYHYVIIDFYPILIKKKIIRKLVIALITLHQCVLYSYFLNFSNKIKDRLDHEMYACTQHGQRGGIHYRVQWGKYQYQKLVNLVLQ